MKILPRYVLRAHLGPFLFAFGALTGVILINTVVMRLADLAGKGLPVRVLLEFFVLFLPSNVALTLPMAVLVAVLYTFSRLAEENEITAMEASGVDLRRLVAPLLLVAALLSAGLLWFNDRILAESNHRLSQLIVEIARTRPLFALREQALNPIRTGAGSAQFYLRAHHIDPATNNLRDVIVYDVRNRDVGRTIYADSGTMAFNAARTDLLLTLFDGSIREVDFQTPDAFQLAHFERQTMRMAGVADTLEHGPASEFRYDRSMTIAMMKDRVDTLRGELKKLQAQAAIAAPSARDPAMVTHHVERLRRQIDAFRVEIHKKYALAAASFIFVLIGVPLALRFAHGGIGMVITVSLVVFTFYYVGLESGESLADEGYLSPGWAMWWMNAILGSAGVLLFRRLGAERPSGREGGWDWWLRLFRLRSLAVLDRR